MVVDIESLLIFIIKFYEVSGVSELLGHAAIVDALCHAMVVVLMLLVDTPRHHKINFEHTCLAQSTVPCLTSVYIQS